MTVLTVHWGSGATDTNVSPPGGDLSLSLFAPAVVVSDLRYAAPANANLLLTGASPAIAVGGNFTIGIPQGNLALSGAAPLVLNSDVNIPAVIENGVTDFRAFTSAPDGVSAGSQWTVHRVCDFQSDGSAMTLFEMRNGNGVVLSLRRTATNTLEYKGFQSDASTAVFSNATAAIPASTGPVQIIGSCNGTDSGLYVTTVADGTVVAGSNTPGSAGNIDAANSTWYFGCTANETEFADDIVHHDAVAAEYIDLSLTGNRERFYDSANNLIRNPGADGSNPFSAQPVVSLQGDASDWLENRGSGGPLDAGDNSGDTTSLGQYGEPYSAGLVVPAHANLVLSGFAPTILNTQSHFRTPAAANLALSGFAPLALAGDPGLTVLASSAGWWEADDASNTVVSTAFSQLTDLSGNGNHWVQGTAGNRPARGTDGDDNIAAEYDATDDFMSISGPTAALMNNFNTGGTVVAVFRPDSSGEGGFGRIWDKNTSSTDETQWVEGGGTWLLNSKFAYASTNSRVRNSSGGTYGVKAIYAARVDKTTDVSDLEVNWNSTTELTIGAGLTEIGSNSGAVHDASAATPMLGNRAANDRTWDGGIYALAFWNTELSDTDLDHVLSYWATKYNITLT